MAIKKYIPVFAAALFILLLSNCTIEKAPPLSSPAALGFIYVAAEDPYGHELLGAAIYLDGALVQNALTPDTIQAGAGVHWIRIEYAAFFPDSQQVDFIADSLNFATITLDPLNPDVGSAIVTASDSTAGTSLEGMIFLDGASTGLLTPDTLVNLPVGMHTIGVGIIGYDYRENEADIAAGLSPQIELSLPPVPWNGIRVASVPESAYACVDDQLLTEPTPWIVTNIPEGVHDFSCYREGYATLTPTLQTANLFAYGHETLNFNLEFWSSGIGYAEGTLAPGFALTSDQGNIVSLGAFRGRVVLVTFWFRDCQPCMEELPYIQQVYSELGSQGFRVLGVNLMAADDLQDLIEVRALLNLTFPLLMDENFTVTQAYGANQFPTNVLVDQRGVVNWFTGSLDYTELSQRVQALLNQ